MKPGNSDGRQRPDARSDEPDNGKAEDGAAAPDESAAEPDTKPDTKPDTDAAEPDDDEEPEDEPAKAELEKAPPIREEPVRPRAASARRAELARPKAVRVAFYLAVASVVVGVFSAIALFLNKSELVRSATELDTPQRLTQAEAEQAVSSLLWLYLVVVLALGAFLTLFAYKAQDGVRRARMMALIITLILLLFHFYFFGTVYGQVSGLLAAITIALMYVPSTREYFGPRQTVR